MRNISCLFLIGLLLLACADQPPLPCSAAEPDRHLHVGETASFSPCFVAEALPLTLQAESSDPAIVGVAVDSRGVTVSGQGVGEVVVTITATDANGQTGRLFVRVVVPNRPPRIVKELALETSLWNVTHVLLTDYVDDQDMQPLRYRIVHGNQLALRVDVRGDTLILATLGRGDFEFAVSATDPAHEVVQAEGMIRVGDPAAYITQAAQSRQSDVPLVANRDGLLRLFLKTDSFAVAMPGATATIFHRDGKPLYSTPLASEASVPLTIDEGSLDRSLNAILDGAYLLPGSTLIIDIDPTVDAAMPRRIEMPLDVRDVRDLDLTLVPVVFGPDASSGGDSSAIGIVEAIVAQPESSELMTHLLHALPVAGYNIAAHEPIVLATDAISEGQGLIRQIALIWNMEGARGNYMAVLPYPLGHGPERWAGAAELGGSVSFATAESGVIAHELGHNFGLLHAPCGGAGRPDRNFPHPGGRIGVWGYDFGTHAMVAPRATDLMGYCFDAPWISDYHFKRALRHLDSSRLSMAADEPRERVLVVWGSIRPDGSPFLEPTFYADGIPTRLSGDSHRITGRDAGGDALFSYRFSPGVVADGPGGSPFVHMIPATWDRTELTSITLDGPTGSSARLDRDSDQPLSIVIRDGQVHSIVRDSVTTRPGSDRVIFSRGIPGR